MESINIKHILEVAQSLSNEFLANEIRKHSADYMHRRTTEALKDLITSCMVLCAKHKAGDTPESLEKAVKDFELASRGKFLLTTDPR